MEFVSEPFFLTSPYLKSGWQVKYRFALWGLWAPKTVEKDRFGARAHQSSRFSQIAPLSFAPEMQELYGHGGVRFTSEPSGSGRCGWCHVTSTHVTTLLVTWHWLFLSHYPITSPICMQSMTSDTYGRQLGCHVGTSDSLKWPKRPCQIWLWWPKYPTVDSGDMTQSPFEDWCISDLTVEGTSVIKWSSTCREPT